MGLTKSLIIWLLIAMLLLAVPRVEGQFGPLVAPEQAPQAQSQQELDAYLETVAANAPGDVIRKVDAFALDFPKSELLGVAYEHQLGAFEQLDNFDGMLSAGAKSLKANPDSPNTLLVLAPAMAIRAGHRADRLQLLSSAETYANQVLQLVERLRVPHKITLEHWDFEKRQMQSQAHEVLGLVAFERGHTEAAIPEYESAVNLSPVPQGIQFLRLGVALAIIGRSEEATKNLRQSVQLGPESVRMMALAQLERLAGIKSFQH